MDKIFMCNQVKLEILNICGLPTAKSYNLEGDTPLFTLGYASNNAYCRALENKLRAIAAQYQTGKQILLGTISKDFTVNQCIKLVLA